MNKMKLSVKQKQILLIAGAIVVVLCTYLFVFQKNMATTSEVEDQNAKLENQVSYLTSLQTKVTELEQQSQEKQNEMNDYLSAFAPKITTEKCIYYIYKMSVDSEVKVTSIEPGNDEKFFENGASVVAEPSSANKKEEKTSEELNEKVPIGQMVGKKAKYTVGITGDNESVMDALDWIRDNDENMSIGATNFSFDSSTGELTGTMEIYFYAMVGNGSNYEAPDLSEFSYGEDNIFGNFIKKNGTDDDTDD